MQNRENAKHINHRLERREFMVYTLASAFAMMAHPSYAQAATNNSGSISAGKVEGSAKGGEQESAGLTSQIPEFTTLFLCGDVMTGRGIDQVLPNPGSPILHERYMKSAAGYVELAEDANGPIPQPMDFSYIWGDALAELERRNPDARIINLETSITRSDAVEDKAVNYRMHPDNIPCITAANIDCCALANNHVLDWGYPGLAETLKALKMAGIKTAGAGENIQQAQAPAMMITPEKGRVLVFSFGSETSGIPWSWAARTDRPGVNLLQDFSEKTVRGIRDRVEKIKSREDIVIAAIHWGSNWGYEVPREQRQFACRLIDEAGVDIVHGHSSHHVKGIEVYREKLILYGCGDFLNDYEGISGHEVYRGDLVLMYFVSVDCLTGRLISLQMTPLQVKRFRLNRTSRDDAAWLRDILNREGKKFGTGVELDADNTLTLRWLPSN